MTTALPTHADPPAADGVRHALGRDRRSSAADARRVAASGARDAPAVRR